MDRQSSPRWTLPALLCCAALLPGCIMHIAGELRPKYTTTVHLSAPLTGLTTIEAVTDIGSITVTGADINNCDITGQITVRAATEEQACEWAQRVRVVARPSGNKLTIKTEQPLGLADRDLTVDLVVFMPRQLALNCSTNVGTVRILEIAGQVKGSTNVGSIICEQVRSGIDLHTNVGCVEIGYAGDAPPDVHAKAVTDVGNIMFRGPVELSAKLEASANVGSVETTRPVVLIGVAERSIKTNLGSAQGLIVLRTNVGWVRIK